MANIYTRYIGTTLNAHAFNSLAEYKQAKIQDRDTKQHRPDILALAKQRLGEFAVVGLTERFQETLYLLAYTFGWPPVVNPTRQNMATHRLDVKEIFGVRVARFLRGAPCPISQHGGCCPDRYL